ncbi:efflux RND transporter periplasmic adaptor subunit [Sinimarinibacterium thermocellulolyticum]|uniref:Efflux RND transporter periplasmic adaptor subunit n=1 Tax=Sinimarinibacterium thermocellulolyticum TaxID=3170016 RepID=A0ABV2A763_9GAMM
MYRILMIAAITFALAACNRSGTPETAHVEHSPAGDAHANPAIDEIQKGPHGGRLLRDGDFALEVTIFERGVPPEFRLYAYRHGQPVAPAQVGARITLTRVSGLPGGTTDEHVFVAKDDYLVSPTEVYEPHSFAVQVQASYAGKTYAWRYDAPEGQVEIESSMAAAQGLQTAIAQAGTIHERLPLYGSIQPDPERVRAVTARFPGLVRSVSVRVGDTVKAGQTLATIESNESLQVYPVPAPISGVVTQRAANPGEAVGAASLFEIADFDGVRAELNVFPRDRARLQPGQVVQVRAADGDATGTGVIDVISVAAMVGRPLVARVPLDNRRGLWTPGQFVDAEVTVSRAPVPLVVPLSAVQTFRDWDVVFVAEGDRYQAQPVELGRRDDRHVEVLSGLSPGARIVIANSWLVKADIEKSGASHDH